MQALWLLFLLFSSWLAYVIFEDTIQGTTLFFSYPATLYQMFVLFTTSNNPDVWIPAYKWVAWCWSFFSGNIVKCPRKYTSFYPFFSVMCFLVISRSSRWSSVFFVLYVLLGVYFVTNLVLAVVYDSFKEEVHISWTLYSSYMSLDLLSFGS